MRDRRRAPRDRTPGRALARRGAGRAASEHVLPDWIVQEALRNAAIPLDPNDPAYDEFVEAELEKLVALLSWCDEVGVEFWRNEEIPLIKRITMTSGEETLSLRRALQQAKQALAERRGTP